MEHDNANNIIDDRGRLIVFLRKEIRFTQKQLSRIIFEKDERITELENKLAEKGRIE